MESQAARQSSSLMEFATALRTELAWDRARAIDAMKIGAACVVGFVIGNWGQFDRPYWILVTILMVGQASFGSVVEKVVMRAIATILGMGLGVGITCWFPQDRWLLSGCFAVLVFVSAVGSRGSWHPQAFLMACVYSGGIAGLAVSDPQSIPAFFYDRCVDIAIGSILVMITFRYIAPRFAARQLVESFAVFCERAADVVEGKKAPSARKAAASVAGMSASFQQGVLEGEALPYGPEHWTHLLEIAERIEGRLVTLADQHPFGGSERLKALFEESMGQWQTELGGKWRLIAKAIRTGTAPPAMEESPGRDAFHQVIGAIRQGPGLPEVPSEQLLEFETWADQLGRVTEDLAEISRAIPATAEALPSRWKPPKWRKVFPLTQTTILHGLRVCLSIGVVIWLGLIFQWSQIVSVVFTAGLIVQATHGGSIRKAVLRLAGCLIGGVITVLTAVFILPHTDIWWQFAPILFLVISFSGYVALGSPRFAYAGLQAGLAYVIVLLPSYQPATNLNPIWERIGAILIGGCVALAITRYFFPERAVNTVRSAMLDAIEAVREMVRAEIHSPTGQIAERARPKLSAVREKLRQLNSVVLEARSESFSSVLRSPDLMRFAGALHDLAFSLAALSHERVPDLLRDRLREGLLSVAAALDKTLDGIKQALDEGISSEDATGISEAVSKLDECLEAVRHEKLTRQFDATAAIAFFSWVEQIRAVARTVGEIARATPRMRLAEILD